MSEHTVSKTEVMNLSCLKTEIGNSVHVVPCGPFPVWTNDEHVVSSRISI